MLRRPLRWQLLLVRTFEAFHVSSLQLLGQVLVDLHHVIQLCLNPIRNTQLLLMLLF